MLVLLVLGVSDSPDETDPSEEADLASNLPINVSTSCTLHYDPDAVSELMREEMPCEEML